MKSDVERNSAAEESSAMNDVQCRRQCDIVTVSVTCPHDRLTGCTGDHNGSCKCSWGQREAKMQHPVAWKGFKCKRSDFIWSRLWGRAAVCNEVLGEMLARFGESSGNNWWIEMVVNEVTWLRGHDISQLWERSGKCFYRFWLTGIHELVTVDII